MTGPISQVKDILEHTNTSTKGTTAAEQHDRLVVTRLRRPMPNEHTDIHMTCSDI
jgi:hypothetical protein